MAAFVCSHFVKDDHVFFPSCKLKMFTLLCLTMPSSFHMRLSTIVATAAVGRLHVTSALSNWSGLKRRMGTVAVVELYADRSLSVAAAQTLPSAWSPPQWTRMRRMNEAWAGKCDMQHVLYIAHYNVMLKMMAEILRFSMNSHQTSVQLENGAVHEHPKSFSGSKRPFKNQQNIFQCMSYFS